LHAVLLFLYTKALPRILAERQAVPNGVNGGEECIIDYPTPWWKRFSQAALVVRRERPDRASASRAQLPFGRRVIRPRGVAKPGAPELLAARACHEQRLALTVISSQAQEKAQ